MGKITMMGKLPFKFLMWIAVVCVPLSFQMMRIQQQRIADMAQPPVPEIMAMRKQVAAVRQKQQLNPESAKGGVVGTRIAVKEIDSETRNPVVMGHESLMSYVYHTSAKQKAFLEQGTEMVASVKKQLDAQKNDFESLKTKTEMLEKQFDLQKEKYKELETKLAERNNAEKQNLKKMVKLYSNMPHDRVAKIIEGMDDAPVVTLLAAMKDVDVAQIMSNMPPRRVAALTLKMSDLKVQKP